MTSTTASIDTPVAAPLSPLGTKAPADMAAAARYRQPWVTDGAWITGLVGVFMILALAYWFGIQGAHREGVAFFDLEPRQEQYAIMLLALCLVAAAMYAVELLRLWRFEPYQFIAVDPLVRARRLRQFFWQCLQRYLLLVLLFFVCRLVYHSLNEYGFRPNNSFYGPWFFALEFLWKTFLIAGLPYILLTRAFKYDPAADRKDLALLTGKVLQSILAKLPWWRHWTPTFDGDDGRAARALAVKFFFAPVMTVFFFDNFHHLQNNFDYLINTALPQVVDGSYDSAVSGRDLGNVLSTMIFAIDVGLAWCGYIISSRWVDNQTISAEPTMLGWIVCLISYPPFRVVGGWFLTGPGETLYLQIPNQMLVGLFGGLMMFSYFLYMLPTIWFGLRFSNLTHRGILRRGPFAVVRHPAYAAKNLGWWLVGFPAAVYATFHSGPEQGLLYLAGLMFLTAVYYARAITEERHLSLDPDYVEYCRHVRYRFIPGVV